MSQQPQQRITPTSLLAWSVLNRDLGANEDTTHATEPHEPIDPKWIEIILGKPDAARMKDCLEIMINKEKPTPERISAFDEFEMLIEGTDNAVDIQNLRMWPVLLSLLQEQGDESEDIRKFAAWVMGTAVQNNPKVQEAFERARGIPIVLQSLAKDPKESVRLKCLYCISTAVRNNKKNFDAFSTVDGWKVLSNLCKEEGDGKIMRRTIFFISALLQDMEEDGDVAVVTLKAIQDYGILDMVLDILDNQSSGTQEVEEYLQFLNSIGLKDKALLDERNIISILENLEKALGDDVHEEIKNYIKSIRDLLNNK